MRVLVAGATGYLGSHVGKELKRRGHWIRALVRAPGQRTSVQPFSDEIVVAQVTEPDTLRGITARMDVVFSSIGITRQRDGLSYEDVDYRGNLNLLAEATGSGAGRFAYVSVFRGRDLRHVDLVAAKERFVDALRACSLPSTVIRPTGFFSDMADVFRMARRGVVVLLGDGTARINPISGHDAAVACVDAMTGGLAEFEAGGPDTYTYNEIAALAFRVLQKRPRVWHVPSVPDALIGVLRRVTPVSVHGPLAFLNAINSHDMVAPARGSDHLEQFFESMTKARL